MLPVEPPDQTVTSELRAILDEELGRLPERHRTAIVLCELEGLTRREAAGRLGVSEGTLSSRLARAKARLRERLSRRGLALSTAILASALTQDAHAVTVPPALVDSTIRVATLIAAGSSLTGVVSTSVVTLTEGVLKAMFLAKLKLVILGLAALAVFTTGVGALAQDGLSDEDRLKNVERKLDKLLEVLGGSSRQTPPRLLAPVERLPQLADAPPIIQPPGPPVVAPPPPVAALPGGLPTPAQPPPPTPVAVPPGALPVSGQPPASPGFGPSTTPAAAGVPGHPGQPKSLAGRVDALEQRLGDLERLIGDLQRRLHHIDRGAVLPPHPPGARSSSRGTMPGTTPRADAAPFPTPTPGSPHPDFAFPVLPPLPESSADAAPSSVEPPATAPDGTPRAESPAPPPPPAESVPESNTSPTPRVS